MLLITTPLIAIIKIKKMMKFIIFFFIIRGGVKKMSIKLKYLQWVDTHVDDLTNKKIIVTGCNSGIGFYVAGYLAYKNATVIMACRDLNKAKKAKNELLQQFPHATIHLLQLNLASNESIQNFVSHIIKEYHQIDILIHNAGVYHLKKSWTKEQFETVMATNYLGTYLLNERILPYIKERIVFTTSIAHRWGKIDYEDFFSIKKYRHIRVYANSKLALSKYFTYLSLQCPLKIVAAHPGICSTNLLDPQRGGVSKAFARCGNAFLQLFMHSAQKGALSTLIAATDPSLQSGELIGPRGIFHISGYPKKQKLSKKAWMGQQELMNYTKKLFDLKS